MADAGPELFISDLHLSAQAPQIAALFFAFLDGPAREAARLTILGDLFDYWAGDDDLADSFNASVVAALRRLADSGTRVAFMAGNRDFLIGAQFAAATGIDLLPDPYVREIGGLRTLLTHGDLLCTDDREYQDFRIQVRAPDWAEHFLAQPLADRKRAIAALRERSEHEKTVKPPQIMDVNDAAVAAMLQAHDARVLIHGHTHHLGTHTHPVDGQDCRRWVLGDWHAERGNALRCSANSCRWLVIS